MLMNDIIDLLGERVQDTTDSHFSVDRKCEVLDSSHLMLINLLDDFYLANLKVERTCPVTDGKVTFSYLTNSIEKTGAYHLAQNGTEEDCYAVWSNGQMLIKPTTYAGAFSIGNYVYFAQNWGQGGDQFGTRWKGQKMQIEAIAVNDNNGDDCYQMHNLEFTNGELTNQTNNGLLWRDTSIKLKYDGYDINDFAVGDRFTLSNFSISKHLNGLTVEVSYRDAYGLKIKPVGGSQNLTEIYPFEILTTKTGKLTVESGAKPLRDGVLRVVDETNKIVCKFVREQNFNKDGYGTQYCYTSDSLKIGPNCTSATILYLKEPLAFANTATESDVSTHLIPILLDLAESELWNSDNRTQQGEICYKKAFEKIQILNGRLALNE